MEKFDLSVWLKDKSRKVVTRDGRPVRIICWDRLDNAERVQNILALIRNENREELQSYSEDCKGVIPSYDLFFADEEEETIDDTEMNSLAYLTELGYTCIPPKKEEELTEFEERNIKMAQ